MKVNKVIAVFLIITVMFNVILTNKFNVAMATENTQNKEEITVKEFGGFLKENINGEIYNVQKFTVTSENNEINYNISISNFPEGAIILDENNTEITILEKELFKVAVPNRNIKETIRGIVTINGTQHEYTKNTNIGTIRAKVVYKDGRVKANANIEVKKENEIIATSKTDESGMVTFTDLYPGTYAVCEKDSNGNMVGEYPRVLSLYYSDSVDLTFYDENSNEINITIENEKKKGTIEVHVVDGDNNEIKMNNIQIEISDTNGTIIETLTTNEDGTVVSSRLPIDNTYKIKQKGNIEDYNMDFSIKTIKFSENEEKVVVVFENIMKKNTIKITKVDKDDNSIKLEGVVFGIYNSEDELIEELTTDNNGEAHSSELPINREYKIKEIKTLDNYVLSEETITVFLTENAN